MNLALNFTCYYRLHRPYSQDWQRKIKGGRNNKHNNPAKHWIEKLKVSSSVFFNVDKKFRKQYLLAHYLGSGNSIWVTLWNEVAEDFKNRNLTSLEQPVVMAVSSCYVKRYTGLFNNYHTPQKYTATCYNEIK